MDEVLKDFIKQQLYDELSNTEIIPYNNSIWFIDRENTYWYFELTKTGKLWWRYDYFTNFFKVFNMNDSQFVPLLIEWVEEVLNSKVATASGVCLTIFPWVEEVLNSKVATASRWSQYSKAPVEEVLNSKVSTSRFQKYPSMGEVEEVLNHKVSATQYFDGLMGLQVEEVLNHKVITTITDDSPDTVQVEEVLNTDPVDSNRDWIVGNILNENPTE